MRISIKKILVLAIVSCLCTTAFAQDAPSGTEKKSIPSGQRQETYYLFVPRSIKDSEPRPVIVLMHGAGGSGADQIDAWKDLAQKEHIILLAPNIRNSAADWDQLYDHPEWIRDAIDETARQHPVNNRRIYLWGYSAGGMFAFYFAFLESRYFAAAAVHGGVIENFKYQMADFAVRKIPLAYYMGTKDQWWTPSQAHATEAALTSRSFPLHYVELKNADHNFFVRQRDITRDAWKFMKEFSLDRDPQFDALDLAKIKNALK